MSLDDEHTAELLTFGRGRMIPDIGGAPLLNRRTNAVCGVLTGVRHGGGGNGALATSIRTAAELFGLRHEPDPRWTEAAARQPAATYPPTTGLAGVDIVIYKSPANTINRPHELIGRESLIEQVGAALDEGKRVLLSGLGGNGKTAVAATIADRRVAAGKGPYAWMRFEHADEEAVFEAISAKFASDHEREEIRHAIGDQRRLDIRNVLEKSGLALLVLDDVWSGSALFAVLGATPETLPVLVTSRTKFATSRGLLDRAFEVGDLSPTDALRLLVGHAGKELCRPLDEAEALCRDLGYHAFAVVIAGCRMSNDGLFAADMRESLRDAPHDMVMPGEFAAEGRASVALLLEQSYRALRALESLVFTTFGAMASPGATVDLLAACVGVEPTEVQRALGRLSDLNLAKRSGKTRYYRVHDLTFSYARSLRPAPNPGHLPMIRAVRDFVRSHVDDHDLLALDLENVLGGAARARNDDAGSLVSILGDLAAGGFVGARGHGSGLLRLMDDAIEAARREKSTPKEVVHQLLSKRGNVHVALGEAGKAIPVYREALALSPSPRRAAVLLAVMGMVYFGLGEQQEAHASFAEAYGLAETINDDTAMLRVLEQHSIAAFREADYERAIQAATRGIELSRKLDDRTSEVSFLTNLGSTEFEVGVRSSRQRHELAREIAERIHDDEQLALAERALGTDFHAMEKFEKARQQWRESLRLYEALNHTQNENEVRTMMRQFGYLD